MKSLVVLVSHEPDKDPRIKWEYGTAAQLYDVTLLGINDNKVGTEKRNFSSYSISIHRGPYRAPFPSLLGAFIKQFYCAHSPFVFFILLPFYALLAPLAMAMLPVFMLFVKFSGFGRQIKSYLQNLSFFRGISLFIETLLHNAYLSVSLIDLYDGLDLQPDVIHCHDLTTLYAGVYLKKRYDCKLVYDAHELWYDMLPGAPKILKFFLKEYEKRLCQSADQVMAVTPYLADIMSKEYKIDNVEVVPNAETYKARNALQEIDASDGKVIFLFQGLFFPERGLEELIVSFGKVPSDAAILYLRGPQNDFRNKLEKMAAEQVKTGKIVFLEPIKEEQLIEEAKFAHVGLIPYRNINLNYKYCCPNKLSQYLHAGLAILCNDLVYVKEQVQKSGAGLSYSSADENTFIEAAMKLINDRPALSKMKINAFNYGKNFFNWERLSEPALLKVYNRLN